MYRTVPVDMLQGLGEEKGVDTGRIADRSGGATGRAGIGLGAFQTAGVVTQHFR